jgi:hypothetical protein
MKLRIWWFVCLIILAGFSIPPALAVGIQGDTGAPAPAGVFAAALARPAALAPGTAEGSGPEIATLTPTLSWSAVPGAED